VHFLPPRVQEKVWAYFPNGADNYGTDWPVAYALPDIEERLANCGVEFELTQPVGVDAAEELLKRMERDDAELLVIGIRDRNPVGKLLLGSAAILS